jgi:DNA-3-methyladenine glycosylase
VEWTELDRPAVEVAPQLLGAHLIGRGVVIRVTEVEAYLGEEDPGSHAFRGRSPRTATMFGDSGHLYAYFTYGMHVCANIVCSPAGVASAVLIRAGEVIDGAELARHRRATSKSDCDLASGPARLTVAAGIALSDDGTDLASGPIRLELPRSATSTGPVAVAHGPRTGVSGAGGTDLYPWRFWIPGDVTVSPYRAHVPKRPRVTLPT